MSSPKIKISREQLAAFAPNAQVIRAFEQMLLQLNVDIPDSLEGLTILIQEAYSEAQSGSARADQANSALQSIAESLQMLAAAPAVQADNFLKADYIDIDTLPPEPAYTVGRLWWNQTGTLNLGMGNGNITQQVGEEVFIYGKASAAITDGQLVRITGTVGASGVVTLGPTTAGMTDPNDIVGVATENIDLNAFGRITTIGIVRGINTSGASSGEVWSDGDALWYKPTGGGLMTNVRPSAPNQKTQVAVVISAGPGSSGSLQVLVERGSALGVTDSNVEISALADKNILQYDSGLGYWKNVSQSAGGVVAAETHAASTKATPVDADEFPLIDSAASFSLKKWTWANIKTAIAAWLNSGAIPIHVTTAKATTTMSVGNATPSASGAGLTFPATQSASSDKNTLDDYEEDAFVPTWNGGSLTVNSCTYTKIGRLVYVMYDVTFGASASASVSTLSVPFALSSSFGSGAVNFTDYGAALFVDMDLGNGATTPIAFRAAANGAALACSTLATKRFIFNVVYNTST
ncbi:hypothetical protein SAMN03159489_05967 [Pseudomonas sp. NFPP07]|uniref:hypothetical protein n=1 Tax=Pseudomonas sp. NFPP07 TaxID=1566213 RepID=UPI0008DF31F3|nr:hypothetical protein [Pseudomonas sp. NFPP07]SFQ82475.1 hypothetical protein SAMN03159489_05967 [Pseudomonas sp. NFPP07]